MLYTERTRRYTDRRSSGALRPPFYSDLLWYSKKRVGSTVIDEITKNDATPNNGELIFDPATEIIDLEKYKPYTVVDGWNTVTFKTIEGDKVYRIIRTFADLDRIRNGLGLNYILARDIDLDIAPYNTGEGWEPIGNFTGVFNGNGNTVKHLFINSQTDYIGLFSRISSSSAVVSNLNIMVDSITGINYAGGLSGYVERGALIINCSTLPCSNDTLINCDTRAGGLVAEVSSGARLINCYSTCDASASSFRAGGLIAVVNNGAIITNCYSCGNIVSPTQSGGLIGITLNTVSTITNSYWDTQTSGQTTSSGGVGLITEQIKLQASFVDWDFEKVWNIDPLINDGYPYLRTLGAGYTNWLSNYKIINIPPKGTDAYIEFPDNINFTTTINGVETTITDFFDRSDSTVYNDTCRGSVHYNSSNPHLWHLTELNTNTLLEYINYDYRYMFFVKNGLRSDGYPATIKEIFLYNKPMNTYDEYSKIKTYLGLNGVYQNIPTLDGNALTFESIERTGSTVVNKINDSKNGELVGRKYAIYNSSHTGDTQMLPDDNWTICAEITTTATESGLITNKKSGPMEDGIAIMLRGTSIRIYIKPINETSFYALALDNIHDDGDRVRVFLSYNRDAQNLELNVYNITRDTLYTKSTTCDLTISSNKLQIGKFYHKMASFLFDGSIYWIKVWSETLAYSNTACDTEPDIMYINHASGDPAHIYDLVNAVRYEIIGNQLVHESVYNETPYNADNGMSIIDGVDGEVPAKLGTQFNALNGDPLTNPATSKIVSNVDGYIIMPNISIADYGSLFDKSNTSIYLPDEEEGFSPYNEDNPFLWHISELTTENIQKHLKQETKFLWFVKNNYNDDGSLKGIISIFSYSKPITNESQRQLVQFYLNESLWNTTGEK